MLSIADPAPINTIPLGLIPTTLLCEQLCPLSCIGTTQSAGDQCSFATIIMVEGRAEKVVPMFSCDDFPELSCMFYAWSLRYLRLQRTCSPMACHALPPASFRCQRLHHEDVARLLHLGFLTTMFSLIFALLLSRWCLGHILQPVSEGGGNMLSKGECLLVLSFCNCDFGCCPAGMHLGSFLRPSICVVVADQ